MAIPLSDLSTCMDMTQAVEPLFLLVAGIPPEDAGARFIVNKRWRMNSMMF